jgi:hypothetical protein
MSDTVTITVSRYHAELIYTAVAHAEGGVATVHDPNNVPRTEQAGRLLAAYRAARQQIARAL